MNVIPKKEVVENKGAAFARLQELDEAIGSLQSTIEALVSVLSPVLMPRVSEGDTVEDNVSNSAREASTELARTIESLIGTVYVLEHNVNNIHRRVSI